MLISVIIPTLNEEKSLAQTLKSLDSFGTDLEIIIADGGSTDTTMQIAKSSGTKLVTSGTGRGTQLNAGARIALGNALLFLHADTELPRNAGNIIAQILTDPKVVGGHFSLVFSGGSFEAKTLTRNYHLIRQLGLCYGDSAMFIRKSVFQKLGGFQDIPLFEDYNLYRRMKALGKVVPLPDEAITSSRRFEGRFFRTFALWVALQSLYWLGVSPHFLNKLYRHAR